MCKIVPILSARWFLLYLHSFKMIFFVAHALVVLAAVSITHAWTGHVAGAGRLTSDTTQDVQFSFSTYSASVKAIVASTNNGPNRTVSSACPVPKLHGVNVSIS